MGPERGDTRLGAGAEYDARQGLRLLPTRANFKCVILGIPSWTRRVADARGTTTWWLPGWTRRL